MLKNNIDQAPLQCPICHSPLHLEQMSVRCTKNHTFNIAKQGYIHFAPQTKEGLYTKDNFTHRRAVLEKGYYNHILNAVQHVLNQLHIESFLDVGCGEGFYVRHLTATQRLGLDIAKDGILLAQKKDPTALYAVGDLAKLPFKNQSIQAILNIFSPANYAEFHRVAQNYIIKVVPTEQHLSEFRALHGKAFNDSSESYFLKHFEPIVQEDITQTFEPTQEELLTFAQMTPLFFGQSKDNLMLSTIKTLTISGKLLVARLNEHL